jgi:hypothetical protein
MLCHCLWHVSAQYQASPASSLLVIDKHTLLLLPLLPLLRRCLVLVMCWQPPWVLP